jgi:ABC-2 type transport system ATP-binding protein
MIKGLQGLGKTIFLTTHYMDEAEYLADRVAIIRSGEIVARGAPRELINREASTIVRFGLPRDAEIILAGIEGVSVRDGSVSIETDSPTDVLYALTTRVHDRGMELADLTVTRASLEDIYLRLAGEPETGTEEATP